MTTGNDTPRRLQIEEAASALFRERGYAATSVRDIAQALNLQGGSLYAHMASKEDVLWSIVTRAADRFNSEVGPVAARSDGSPADRLADMIRAHVFVVTSIQKDAAVFLHEWRFLSPARREEMQNRRDAYEALFRDVIHEGINKGDFRDVDVRTSAMAILSALNGIPTWYRPTGPLTAIEIADRHADMFLHALESCPMTDPISLAPILAPEDRPTPLFADDSLTHEQRYNAFVEHVQSGQKVEARDWMPDEYRQSVLRFVEMHANSELMGVLPEREWIMRAPTLKRKLALTAKVQDECGHAQLLYRVAEDLGKSREQMYQDLLDGKTKFHNVVAQKTIDATDATTTAYAGTLYRTAGPPFFAMPFDSRQVLATPVGTASVAFSDGNAGIFSWSVDGIAGSKAITRQIFEAPGTICQ